MQSVRAIGPTLLEPESVIPLLKHIICGLGVLFYYEVLSMRMLMDGMLTGSGHNTGL